MLSRIACCRASVSLVSLTLFACVSGQQGGGAAGSTAVEGPQNVPGGSPAGQGSEANSTEPTEAVAPAPAGSRSEGGRTASGQDLAAQDLAASSSAGTNSPSPAPQVSEVASRAADAGTTLAEPTLITSEAGAYWSVGEVAAGAGPATVRVDTAQRFQTWQGFGGTFNERGWEALLLLSESERSEAMRLLFDGKDGIGLSWGRIPIGASDYALQRYTLNDNAGDVQMAQFDIRQDEQLLIPFIQAAQAVKGDIRFWASPWTPPAWMKSNAAFDRGEFEPQYFDAMARYLVRWVQAYQAHQIPIEHVQPQNEPGWSQAYPSCAWGPSTADGVTTERPVTLGTFVEEHLAPALVGAGLNTKIWYGTLSNNGTYEAYWEGLSPAGRQLIEGVGLQWGTASRVAELAQTGLLVMQTEHRCGNYPWLGQAATSPADANRNNFLASQAPNNHAYGEESWDLIKQWVEAGVHVYNAWNMVLDEVGLNMDETRPWPQNALMVVNRATRTLTVTPTYYVFRHIGQYVEPGAVRVAVEGGNALAFINPDGSVVTALFNEGSEAAPTTLSIDGQLLQFEVPARGWATVNWQG